MINDTKQKILEILNAPGAEPLTREQLAKRRPLKGAPPDEIAQAVSELILEGRALDTKKGLLSPRSKKMLLGRFEGNARGFGFVTPLPGGPGPGEVERDVFVPERATAGAMHGDTVLIKMRRDRRGDAPDHAEVVRVVARGATEVTGRLEKVKGGFRLIPDDRRLCDHIDVARGGKTKLTDGDKAALIITKYPEAGEAPKGRVARVFGGAQTVAANYMAVLHGSDIPVEFATKVIRQAEKLHEKGVGDDYGARRDLRGELIFTIDGAGAKDFDDAVSIKVNERGNTVLGVHIADVSHYVTEGSPLDASALERGTSIYFADRVVPMLPEQLSDELCSLMPGVDRLTLTVDMELDDDGGPVGYEIYESVICSRLRCVYEQLNLCLDGGADRELKAKYKPVLPAVRRLAALAEKLEAKRRERGALEIDTPEAEIVLDDAGAPVDVRLRTRGRTERIIEECMILCNETVAAHMQERGLPSVYRVHEQPDPTRMLEFLKQAEIMGAKLPRGEDALHAKGASTLLSEVSAQFRGGPLERVIGIMETRTLQKARYSPDNSGHFGLASEKYLHFTSPIRRYPDLFVHRVLKEALIKKPGKKRLETLKSLSAHAAVQSSETELRALRAERDIEQLFKTAYMAGKVGESFDGVVSTVKQFGFFVELPDTVEGLVRAANLDDDYYEFDEAALTLRGVRTGRAFRPGDAVRVTLTRADLETRQIDFVLE